MKIVLAVFLTIFFLSSCSLTQPKKEKNIQKIEKKESAKTKIVEKKKKKRVITGMLRGVILSQNFDKSKKLWLYKLKVIDIANDTLKNIDFYYKKRVLDSGDLVYVLFDKQYENMAKDIILIKKSYKNYGKKTKLSYKSSSLNFHKRTKARQTPWIGLPKTNTINLK